MKPDCFAPRLLSPLIASLLLCSSLAVAQRKNRAIKNVAEPVQLSLNERDALDLLKSLAQSLKGESDKLAAAPLQARIAGVLWEYDEAFAKDVFRWSFDAARQSPPADLPKAKRAAYVARQAAGIREVLTRLGARDQKRAEAWLKAFEEETLLESRSSEPNQFRSELLIQIALQLSTSKPDQAQRLGLLSLAGTEIPGDFGRLLFALSTVNRSLSNELFRAAIANLRRNDRAYDSSLITLVNYVFSSSGALHFDAAATDARLLADYFVDAAWLNSRTAAVNGLPETSAMFYSLVEVRGLPIVSRYAAERLPELQGQMRELASRLTQPQLETAAQLRSAQQQQITLSNRNSYDISEQIDRATKEKNAQVRDSLLNSIAHSLMRSDSERALHVVSLIDDDELRMQAEDDVHLVKVQTLLFSRSYDEARKTAHRLNNDFLEAKVLVELASKVLAENKDTGRAIELLSEASKVISQTESMPDKLLTLLLISQQFAKFDPTRGFETLGTAIKTVNQFKAEETPTRSVLSKPRLLNIKTYTVINGSEMSTSDHATIESIDFSQIAPLVAHDYLQTRLLGNKIEHPLRRATFLIAVTSTMLSKSQGRASDLTASDVNLSQH